MSGERPPIGEDDLVAAVDGRLAPERAAAVEAFLAEAPEVAGRIAAERRDRDALREALAPIAAEPIPSRLRIAAIRAEQRRRRGGVGRIAAALLIFAVGMGAGALVTRGLDGAGAPRVPAYATVAEEASAAHRTFVVEVAHPVEVDAGREAHLLGWLSKRLGRRIVAPDLASFGWKLIGGRLLPAGTTAAAQLMYEDAGGKRMTLWVQAIDGETTAFRFRKDANSSTFAWVDRGWGFAVTAPLDRDGLLPIAEAVYERLDAGGDAGAAGRS